MTPTLLPSNEYWGRRYGSWDRSIPKGMSTPVGWAFKIKRGSRSGGSNNSETHHRWHPPGPKKRPLRSHATMQSASRPKG